MPEVSRKRTGELIRKLFDILMPHSEGLAAGEALALLRNQVQLTDYEKGTYKSGSLRFDHIVRFGTVDCVKAGWLTKHKGKWTITEEERKPIMRFPIQKHSTDEL
jgi:restriction system protein